MKTNRHLSLAVLATTAIITGCAPNRPLMSSYPSSTQVPATASMYGVVDSIQVVQTSSGASGGTGTSGVGTVAGGVVGGLLGNQVGSGHGRTAATIAGAVGGAMVGNQMEKNAAGTSASTQPMYQIGVRLDNGSYQTIQQDTIADLQVGSRVRVENGHAYRY